jgi:hypothetical protein
MKRWLPLAAAAVLAGAAWTQEEAPPLGRVWARRAPRTLAVAVSPDGERILAAGGGGEIRCFEAAGGVAWEVRIDGIDELVTSRLGATTLAYSAGQPLSRKVHFLDSNGRRLGTLEPSEAVETAVVSSDGKYAALAAGKSVIFCSRAGSGIRHRVIPLKGIPTQVQFGVGDTIYVACREPDFVALVKSNGKELWRRRDPVVRGYSVSAADDGRHVAIAGESDPDTLRVSLVTWRNQTRWTDARPGRRPRIRLSAGGGTVMLSYEHKVAHGTRSRFERRLAYLGEGAGGGWPKGGAFSAPLYVAVDRNGEWVVALDTQNKGDLPRFRLYGKGGERRWFYTAPSSILIATASAEGRHIAAYRADGFLELLRVSTP